MSYRPPVAAPAPDDTPSVPVDERPPYAPARWPIVVAAGLALAVVVALVVAFLAVRWVVRAVRRRHTRREVIMFPTGPDWPYAGPQYRCEFFDDTYPQLTDMRLAVALPSMFGPDADRALDALARELAAEVELRDGQRCFRPCLVVYGAMGKPLRSWSVASW